MCTVCVRMSSTERVFCISETIFISLSLSLYFLLSALYGFGSHIFEANRQYTCQSHMNIWLLDVCIYAQILVFAIRIHFPSAKCVTVLFHATGCNACILHIYLFSLYLCFAHSRGRLMLRFWTIIVNTICR